VTDVASCSHQRQGEGGREPSLRTPPSRPAALSSPAAAPFSNRQKGGPGLDRTIAQLEDLPLEALVLSWRNHLGGTPPRHLPRWLMAKLLAYRLQAQEHGDLSPATLRLVRGRGGHKASGPKPFQTRSAALRQGGALRPGSVLMREWQGRLEQVRVLEEGFAWQGSTYASLSAVAKAITGTSWNGHRFFGLAQKARPSAKRTRRQSAPSPAPRAAEAD
jgi:Protein of unknown function (DUF2924)